MEESYTNRYFTEHSMEAMISVLCKYYPEFNIKKFKKLIHVPKWESLAIKGKVRHVTEALFRVLPEPFNEAVEILLKAQAHLQVYLQHESSMNYLIFYSQDGKYLEQLLTLHWSQYS